MGAELSFFDECLGSATCHVECAGAFVQRKVLHGLNVLFLEYLIKTGIAPLDGCQRCSGLGALVRFTGQQVTRLSLTNDELLYFGDQLCEGNDYPVKSVGIDTISVRGWEEAALAIQAIIEVS